MQHSSVYRLGLFGNTMNCKDVLFNCVCLFRMDRVEPMDGMLSLVRWGITVKDPGMLGNCSRLCRGSYSL